MPMSEPRANAYLNACLMLVAGSVLVLITAPLLWLGIFFMINGTVTLLIAWRASDELLARLQRRWLINPIEASRVLRGK